MVAEAAAIFGSTEMIAQSMASETLVLLFPSSRRRSCQPGRTTQLAPIQRTTPESQRLGPDSTEHLLDMHRAIAARFAGL